MHEESGVANGCFALKYDKWDAFTSLNVWFVKKVFPPVLRSSRWTNNDALLLVT